ncbi:MAG TPA: peptide MFS transporter [Steroidobacteraceae bacterium]|nr:peptide MFS transporter [Steroidobacteraceae bacterium]
MSEALDPPSAPGTAAAPGTATGGAGAPALSAAPPGAAATATLFGHPRGLATLFFTEMWERFTYYGMRAILVLFMVATLADGGLGIGDRQASSIYGLFVAGSYLFSILGGWIADTLIGGQRAVLCGGLFIVAGNALLTSGMRPVFFSGLALITLGVGLLKPNVSALVARLYPQGGSRRDAGFSLFYMGINVGALLGALLVPLFAARFGWHWGFGLPALGMTLGLVQFLATRHYLAPFDPQRPVNRRARSWLPVVVFGCGAMLAAALTLGGAVRIDPQALAAAASWLIALLAAAFLAYLLYVTRASRSERHRVYVMIALFIASTMYYAGIEQTGTSLTLFAERYTDRHFFGWEIPAGVFQAVSSVFVIIFAPLFSALWIALERARRDPPIPVKFAAGLVLMGSGFLVMYFASRFVLAGRQVLPTWLVLCYLVQMWGDLCLAPVGLSSMTKLAPPRLVGQVMGLWFLSIALGNNLAGQLATEYDATHLASIPALFLKMFEWGALGGGLMLLLTPMLKRLMAGVR